jgi:hypothetical protein
MVQQGLTWERSRASVLWFVTAIQGLWGVTPAFLCFAASYKSVALSGPNLTLRHSQLSLDGLKRDEGPG